MTARREADPDTWAEGFPDIEHAVAEGALCTPGSDGACTGCGDDFYIMRGEPMNIECRFCGGTNCDHGDHCADCGCPKCGTPGARFTEADGNVRGFCYDCEWEAVPGAYKAWKARQPVKTTEEMRREVLGALGANLPPDDEVGPMLLTVPGQRAAGNWDFEDDFPRRTDEGE
jgi:hypothetical protein